jgi:hypothetical protein
MEKNRPVHSFQLGRIRAAIWANKAEDGNVWLNVTITRSYNDGKQLQDTTTFRRDDLPIVAKAADLAYAWIWQQQAPAHPDETSE